jgi:aryl-alcohol dehydrogenase-like predicted oxidoreductase
MKFRKLGRTGFEVSEIAQGLWGMGSWPDSDDRQSRKSLQLAADLGCNFFDSAWAYGDGKADGLLGELLAARSDRAGQKRLFAPATGQRPLYAASKIAPLNRRWPASPRDSYSDVFPANYVLEQAGMIRRKIGTDTIDLLQLHVWDDSWTEAKEFHETVARLKRDGVVRAFGLSLNRWQPENGVRALRTGLVDSVQVIYNIFDQNPEDELFPLCRELDIGVVARVPLDEGSLGGKLTAETKFDKRDFRNGYFNAENRSATLERIARLNAILPDSMTLPELALRFILSNPVVSTVIVGMRNPEHVQENLALGDAGPLDPALIAELRKHRWVRRPKGWSG